MLDRPFCPLLACRGAEAGGLGNGPAFAPFRDGARTAWRGTWALSGRLDAHLGHQREIGLALAITALAGIGATAQPEAFKFLLAARAGDLEAFRSALHRDRGTLEDAGVVIGADLAAGGDAPADQRVGLLGRLRGETVVVCGLAAERAEAAVEVAAAALVDVGRATSETVHDVVGRPVSAGR